MFRIRIRVTVRVSVRVRIRSRAKFLSERAVELGRTEGKLGTSLYNARDKIIL